MNLVPGVDLQLLAVRFVDNGHPDQQLGPRYRVWFRNNGPANAAPFNVLLAASNDPVPNNEMPQAGVVYDQLEPGEIRSVDIRLPLAANQLVMTPEGKRTPFNYLHVLVNSHRDLPETDFTNNGSVLARTEVLPVDPAVFSSDQNAISSGATFNVAGEGFGPEPGQAVLVVNGTQVPGEIQGWYDLGVRITVPPVALDSPMNAELLIVRGDGAASNPLELQLAPGGLIGSPVP